MSPLLLRAFNDPAHATKVLHALLRGTFYFVYYRLFKRNVKIALPFRAFASVTIVGPGRVFIDGNCSVIQSAFKGLTIVTLAESAAVTIGKDCILGGLTVRCHNQIEIGKRTRTANSLIQDVLFINHEQVRSQAGNVPNERNDISIGNNAWVGMNAIVLSGSQVNDDCVLSVGSVCQNITLAPYSFASGNPVRRGLPIDNLIKLTGGT
jgi:acetyltransferase-like isoleucine patch superfamily enzyme